MFSEYNLTKAGEFTEPDLLDFIASEAEKGNTVEAVTITSKQLALLLSGMGIDKPIKKTGKKLVDFWNTPKIPDDRVHTIHGVRILLED